MYSTHTYHNADWVSEIFATDRALNAMIFMLAASHGHTETVLAFIDLGVYVDKVHDHSTYGLLEAAALGHQSLAERLLLEIIDINNTIDSTYATSDISRVGSALGVASYHGQKEII